MRLAFTRNFCLTVSVGRPNPRRFSIEWFLMPTNHRLSRPKTFLFGRPSPNGIAANNDRRGRETRLLHQISRDCLVGLSIEQSQRVLVPSPMTQRSNKRSPAQKATGLQIVSRGGHLTNNLRDLQIRASPELSAPKMVPLYRTPATLRQRGYPIAGIMP